MINSINSFLKPIELLIKKYQKYIGYFFILLSVLSISLGFSSETVKFTGEQAMNVLWFLLYLPIFSRVFGLSLARTLMPLRKEIGIFMGTLALVHTLGYIVPYPEMIFDYNFWIDDGFLSYLSFGFLGLICTIPLLVTSNTWAIRKLGKNWKRLHRLAYFIIIFIVIHVVLIKFAREFEIIPVLLLIVYFVGKTFEWRGIRLYKIENEIYQKGQKWLCVPCGYIYDPAVGDLDSGIKQGTEFIDIPNNWVCPVCGLSKSDFVPYEEGKVQIITYPGIVIEKSFLNSTTLEFIVDIKDIIKSYAGQFISFVWTDSGGEFTRSYSIANQNGKSFTFLIKLSEYGRGSHLLKEIKLNANILIRGNFGNFVLKDTTNPKVFIATGTGLAPIYNMIHSLPSEIKKTLYFSVATRDELFYVEKLRALPNLDLHIHITRENIAGYKYGRVDANLIDGNQDTEWYLCGNPKMVSETTTKLQNRGFDKIYSEEF